MRGISQQGTDHSISGEDVVYYKKSIAYLHWVSNLYATTVSIFYYISLTMWCLFAVPSNNDDEFERWQREVIEAEAKAEAEAGALNYNSASGDVTETLGVDDEERPPTPPEGEREFTDDDGTTYKWDLSLRAWVPQVTAVCFSLSLCTSVSLS